MSDVNTSNNDAPVFKSWDDIAGYTEGFRLKFKRNPSIEFEAALALLQTAWAADDAASLTADDYTELFVDAETDEEDATKLVSKEIANAVSAQAKKHPIALRAENLAAQLNSDATFRAFVDGLAQKKIDVERGALETLFHLRRVYGEKLKEFPIVGSKGGNNPDLYQGEYFKANGDKATKEMSFYTAFSTSLPSYIAKQTEREAVLLAAKDNTAANVAPEYKGKTKWFLNGKAATLKTSLGNIKGWCIKAFVIEQNLERINSEMGTKVKASLVSHRDEKTGKEEPAPGITDCFAVGDWTNGHDSFFAAHTTLNITKFTSLDIDEAKKNGGTYDALMATIKREPKKQQAGAMAVGTFDQLQSAWALSLSFYQTLKTPEQRATLKAKIVSDKAGFLETVFNMKEELVALCADTDLQKVYARHMAAKVRAEANATDEQKTGTDN